jgi:hypothetical protein
MQAQNDIPVGEDPVETPVTDVTVDENGNTVTTGYEGDTSQAVTAPEPTEPVPSEDGPVEEVEPIPDPYND